MAAVPWSVYYDEVLPWAPGCSTTLADAAIRRAVIELCDRGLIWQMPLTAINAVANQMTYALSAGISNMTVAKVLKVSYLDKELTRKSTRQLDRLYPGVDWRTQVAERPSYFTEEQPGKLMLVPAPAANSTGAIDVVAAIRPTEAATGIDDTNFDYWREYVRVVADGALGYIKAEPRKPYSDPKGAMERKQRFEDAIGAYAFLASRGRGANGDNHVVTHFN